MIPKKQSGPPAWLKEVVEDALAHLPENLMLAILAHRGAFGFVDSLEEGRERLPRV